MTIITILVFILILSILVLIHEAGHFFVAKKFGVKVEEFGFGFPPRIYGKKIGETIYSINLLPVGGFVRLYGEDDAGSGRISSKNKEVSIKDKERAFFARPVWQRACIVVAGVVMNFLLALIVISFLFTTQGIAQPTGHVLITEILKHSPAEAAGLQKGDVIVAIADKKVVDETEVKSLTSAHANQSIAFEIFRKGKMLQLSITPKYDPHEKRAVVGIGITQDIVVKKYPWYQAPFAGLKELVWETWMILAGLGTTVQQVTTEHKVPQGLAGPVGIEQIVGQFIQYGIYPVLSLVSLLSLNLAVLNVLPIPALDGGRLFFILFEGVTGKKVNQKFEGYVHMVGMIVLLSLIALLTYHDITRIIRGESLIPQ